MLVSSDCYPKISQEKIICIRCIFIQWLEGREIHWPSSLCSKDELDEIPQDSY